MSAQWNTQKPRRALAWGLGVAVLAALALATWWMLRERGAAAPPSSELPESTAAEPLAAAARGATADRSAPAAPVQAAPVVEAPTAANAAMVVSGVVVTPDGRPAVGAEVSVCRNDETTVEQAMEAAPDAIVLSPGPCGPAEAGICLDLIKAAAPTVPIFGVCLGHQALGEAFGGEVVRAPVPVHGKLALIDHEGETLFHGVNGPFRAVRYHSLVVRAETIPADLKVTAWTDGLVMAMSHKRFPAHGVQFHPESIASEHGARIFDNFLSLAARWNESRRQPAA